MSSPQSKRSTSSEPLEFTQPAAEAASVEGGAAGRTPPKIVGVYDRPERAAKASAFLVGGVVLLIVVIILAVIFLVY